MHNHNKISIMSITTMIFFICMSTFSTALGIAPSKKIIEYKDYMQQYSEDPNIIMSSRIINTDGKNMTIKISAAGELAGYATIIDPMMYLSSTDAEKSFRYRIDLPQGLAPGEHLLVIAASQVKQGTDTNALGGFLEVSSQIQVNVPHEGLFASGYISTSTKDNSQDAVLTLSINNDGDQVINRITGTLAIKDAAGTTVYDSNIGPYNSIMPGQSLKDERSAGIYKAGIYTAEYKVYYDDKNFSISKEFEVGEYDVKVVSTQVDNFKLGTIAKIDINLLTQWNTPIEGSYVQIILKDQQGKVLQTAKTSSSTLMPKSSMLSAYLDTKGLQSGNYILGVNIYAGNKIITKEYQSRIENDQIIITEGNIMIDNTKEQYPRYITAAILIILACVGVAILLKMHPHNNTKKGNNRRPL